MPALSPPVLKEMRGGARLAKSLAGDTTLAAMLTDTVAMRTPTPARIATITRVPDDAMSGSWSPGGGVDDVSCARMYTGSKSFLISTPVMIALDALVMTTPMAEKRIMVVG